MVNEKRLYEVLGARLRQARERQQTAKGRLTQAHLAALIGLERTSITNIEKGSQKLPLHVLYRLCEALGASIAEVLPAVPDVQSPGEPPKLEALELGGHEYFAPPLVKQKIDEILSQRLRDAPTHK